ncbi:unnamed protein product [Rotaria socialis]|uniref:Midasin n=1 Tax=Rotaria socialis TaxID=392032 RepID=A0A819AM40_9BILA|nr:unnamed protein product [Rotaria socialis]
MTQENVITKCDELTIVLNHILDRDADPYKAQNLIDELVNMSFSLTKAETKKVLRSIFYPYGTLVLTNRHRTLAMKMAKLMEWWLKSKSNDGSQRPLMDLICEQRIILVRKNSDGSTTLEQQENPNKTMDLSHLMLLFNVYDCTGSEMNALIKLLIECLLYTESKLGDMRQYLIEPDCFKCLWLLYFDPLRIKRVLEGDELVQREAVNKEEYQSSSKHQIYIQWTDDLKDKYIDGNITKRQRVNMIVHEALSACKRKQQLLSLLQKIQFNRSHTIYVLQTWINLFRHLISIKYVDIEIIQLLFERLPDLNIINASAELNQLILDLLEMLPQFNDAEQLVYVGNQIVRMIQNLMVSEKLKNKIELVEELMKRICASTPVNNIQGHYCFFFLLKDLIPFYDKHNEIRLIKRIDHETILWYADDILQKKTVSQPMAEHCQTLLTLLQYVTMYTDDNYLEDWFQRIQLPSHQNAEFIFQMITYSIYSSSTLATYVRQITDEKINEFLKCIQIPIAFKFISILLTIIEALVNSAQAHIILFRSDDFHRILEDWLLSETSPSIIMRLLVLLFNVADSGHNQYSVKIADFFLGNYASKFFSIHFEDQSPFASIIRFLLSISNNNQINGSSLHDKVGHLIKDLFLQIEEIIDEDDDNLYKTFSLHLLSLSNEITDEQVRTKLVILLSPFIPDMMALLGQSDQLKYASIKLLGKILELSEDEHSLFAENFQYGSIHDDTLNHTNDTLQQQQQQQQPNNLFFSSEVANRLEIPLVRHSDFIHGNQFLKKLEQVEQRIGDKLLRERLTQQRSENLNLSIKDDQFNHLVLTPTTCENIFKVLEVLDDPIPILLEGNTGVGKSATVMEAFRQACMCKPQLQSRTFFRFNMSSHVTVDDLLGKVMLAFDKETCMTNFRFVHGLFTRAFVNGHWILFDELNLAQDTVLQAIESALDTRRLTINNNSSTQDSIIVYQMHDDFRLFATQNPSTGFFKDKREKLSSSFLSRFRPLVFTELPDFEWRDIVQQRLKPYLGNEADQYADLLVTNFNNKIKEALYDSRKGFAESGPYAEISIRELLKWVNQLIWQKQHGCWPTNAQDRGNMLSFSAWCIYGARYRTNGRTIVENILTDNGKGGWGRPALQNISIRVDQKEEKIFLDNIQCSARIKIQPIANPELEWFNVFKMAGLETIKFNADIWTIAFKVHNAVHKMLINIDFIYLHGIYRIDYSWLWHWLTSAAHHLNQRNEFGIHGCKSYISRFRHIKAQNKVRSCFIEHFEDANLSEITSKDIMIQPDMPYILTDRTLQTMKQVSFDMNIKQPILVTGPEGCGKSDLLLALTWLNGQQVNQLNITPETEPSALIGQILPNEAKDKNGANNGKMLDWNHGCVTRAYINGQWALLDNFNTAEASVLERLNPILEEKPMLILTENGEIDEQNMHDDYRLFATMTPPDSRYSSLNVGELSPSLYNRFATVHMNDIDNNSDELLQLAKGLLSDDVDSQLAVDLCREILDFLSKNAANISKVTLRNLVRFFDSTYRLYQRFQDKFNFVSILWTAYHVTIVNQIKGEQIKIQMTESIKRFLRRMQPNCQLRQLPFTDWIQQTDEHILTSTRLNYANAVLGAVACNIPLLLEGPAAVGKTTLIAHLCKTLDSKKMNHISSQQKPKLERVNNTDTTTIQDYLGTYLPVNDGFIFQKGALYRAMENGWWFLADEFNLADPSVMNILFPLLEGKNSIMIPTSGKIITAKQGFHFFATQNDSSYANRHQLPISLRNRFLEIQFDEFPESELSEILLRRNQSDKQKQKNLINQIANSLASFYHQLIQTPSRITFRELIKWIRRYELFSSGKDVWPMVGASLLTSKYPLESPIRQGLINDLKTKWPNISIPTGSQIEIKDVGGGLVRFRENDLHVDVKTSVLSQSIISTWPLTFQRTLTRIAQAVHANEPVLLIGPTSCKTLIVETWTRVLNRYDELVIIHLTPESESANLVGEIQPYTFLDLLKRLPAMAERVVHRFRILCQNQNSVGKLYPNDEDFINSLTDLITKDFNDEIDQFEKDYSHEKELNQQKNALHNNFATLREYTEFFMMPSFDENSIGKLENMIETITNSTEPQRKYTDYEYSPRLYRYDDDDDDDDDNVDNPLSKRNQSTMKSYEKLQLEDDGYDDYGSIDIISNTTINIKDNSATEPNISVCPKTTCELYDDYDLASDVEESESAATNQRDSNEITTSTQNTYPNLINSAVGAASSNVFESHFESLPIRTVNQTDFLPKIYQTVRNIQRGFEKMIIDVNYSSFCSTDATLVDYQAKFSNAWERLSDEKVDRTRPIFIFNDGPVITAAKRGGILFLEDLDLPSQAVVERLNSMLEPDPTLTLSEDVTTVADKGQLDISLSKTFQIFASVHQDEAHQLLKLSPSTRSRFTEIHVPTYSKNELEDLVRFALNQPNSDTNEIAILVEQMFSLREKLRTDPEWKLHNDIQLLFRWVDFIKNHHTSLSLTHRMLLGARFFCFDLLSTARHTILFDEWLSSSENFHNLKEFSFIFKQPDALDGAITLESIQSNERIFPFEVHSEYIGLRYTGVRYSCRNDKDLQIILNKLRQDFFCVPTPTLINQIARVFAATSSKAPLLLVGPPGTGKTQVITQVCSLLGKECERINLSANTSLDQLIGCIIPRCVNGIRIFQWQEGRVLSAIRAQHWILFDELNLATPEVLEGLAPLFYRGITHYTIRSTGERVPVNDVLIFATMNPSTAGGGRSKLPRSINNLFTIVQIDDYSEEELRIILNQLFSFDLEHNNINMAQLDQIFNMHVAFKLRISEGALGRTDEPYKINLRDLSKLRDVFRHSIDNQLSHYEFLNTIVDENISNEDNNNNETRKITNELSSTLDSSTARLLSIRKFAQVVYACQFQGEQDYIKACEIINRKFPISDKIEEKNCSIDMSSPAVVRIGSIYIKTGSEEPSTTANINLIHTKKTISQLESLAAACQSKRTILLEGDICTRKTTLVIELARITRHRLIIIPLHENYETTDLIGSWLPNVDQKREHPLFSKIEILFKQIIKQILLRIIPLLSADRKENEFDECKKILRSRTLNENLTRDELLTNEINALKNMINLLNRFSNVPGDEAKIYVSCYIQQAMDYMNKLREFQSNTAQEIGFTFVESEFVQAIREGCWVLFDNVNSAPSEGLERLNSLTEDNPVLSLYEFADGQILTKKDNPIISSYKNSNGQILTEKIGIIHENFRLFATANLNRIYSNKLSSAFLNRVIRIWLPPIDECDEKDPTKSDLYELVSTQLMSIPAGKQLAHLLLLIHIHVKQYVKDGQLVYPTDYRISYRLLEQCVRTLISLVNKGATIPIFS